MTGCRNLTDPEISKVLNTFAGRYCNRNRLMVILGIATGFRISELLSIKVADVYNGQRILRSVKVQAKNTKTTQGREITLNKGAKKAINAWIQDPKRPDSAYLFSSRKGGAITRQQAHSVLKKAFNTAELDGTLATHTLRKTFANRLLDLPDVGIRIVSHYLGHKNIDVTERYLGLDLSKDVEFMEAISIDFDPGKSEPSKPELINAAQELNKVMGLEPPIDTQADREQLKAQLKEATQIIMESDDISDATLNTVDNL